MHTAIKIYKGLIEPHFDYCSVVWDGLSQQLSEKLQKYNIVLQELLLNQAMAQALGISLGWDNLSIRRAMQKESIMYKMY